MTVFTMEMDDEQMNYRRLLTEHYRRVTGNPRLSYADVIRRLQEKEVRELSLLQSNGKP